MQGNLANRMKCSDFTASHIKMIHLPIRFVDVIHTDILPLTRGGLGMAAAIGHVDFYPVKKLNQ